MNPTATNTRRAQTEPGIYGDRRADRRYPIELELRYKLIRRKRVLETGTGKTLDISSGGICFEAERSLPRGLSVELSITWPVLLRNVAPMQLLVTGKIVRHEDARIAVRMAQHEFRTLGLREASAARPAMNSGFSNSAAMQSGVFAATGSYGASRKVN